MSIDRKFLRIAEHRFFSCSIAPKPTLPLYQVAIYLVNYLKGLEICVLGEYKNTVKDNGIKINVYYRSGSDSNNTRIRWYMVVL